MMVKLQIMDGEKKKAILTEYIDIENYSGSLTWQLYFIDA
jgi:hypothetical protein